LLADTLPVVVRFVLAIEMLPEESVRDAAASDRVPALAEVAVSEAAVTEPLVDTLVLPREMLPEVS
jgi:hypothetical protein